MCVLLVEDESLIREVMAESLQSAGFEVLDVADGTQAVHTLHDRPQRFSILVTDFHMPGDFNGAQVAAELRAVRPDLPVIIVTGRPEVLQASWRAELDYNLLVKPYLPSQLIGLVRSLVHRPVA